MNDKIQLLKSFSRAIAIPLYNTDRVKWPIRPGAVISPVKDLFAMDYINQIEMLFNLVEPQKWNQAFPNSLRLWRVMHNIINGLRIVPIDNKIIASKILDIIHIIKTITNNDDLNHGMHLIMPENDLLLVKNLPFTYEEENLKLLLKLAGLLWSYSESLYFQGREISCEYHGMYDFNEQTGMMIRDYANFVPQNLWRELRLDSAYNDIRIVTLHDKSLSILLDVYNNLNVVKGSFLSSIIGGVLLIDGKISSNRDLNELIDDFSQKLILQTKYVNSLSTKILLEKYLEIFWYRKKELSDVLSLQWNPPKDAYNIIRALDEKAVFQTPNNHYSGLSLEELENTYDFSDYLS